MKTVKRHLVSAVVGILAAGMLIGCGKGDPDPNSGLYEGTKATMMGMTMNVSEVYENGVTFDIQDGGKCVCNLDGDKVKLKWTRDGNTIHFEGGGVELNGTIGGGDMLIENMMDMGMDLELHCSELLHADLANEDGKSSDKDSNTSGSVLARLKDAKAGKSVYTTSSDQDARDVAFWGDPDFKFEEGSGETEVIEYGDDANFDELTNGEGGIDGSLFINPEYENVSGKEFTGGRITVKVPEGWEAFDVSNDHIRVIKGGSSPDDYMSKASIQIEWHDNASGSIDSSNMEDPVSFTGLKLGQHNYTGVSGTVPGNWTSYMMIDQQGEGYFLVTLSLPEDSDVYMLDSDVQAIMASVDVK